MTKHSKYYQAIAAALFSVSAPLPAYELGLSQCVHVIWRDFDKIADSLEANREKIGRGYKYEELLPQGGWTTVFAYPGHNDYSSEVQLCSGSPCADTTQLPDFTYEIAEYKARFISSSPGFSPHLTPATTPVSPARSCSCSPSAGSEHSLPSPGSPLSHISSPSSHFNPAGRSSRGRPAYGANIFRDDGMGMHSPRSYRDAERQGVLFIRRLSEKDYEDKSLLRRVYDRKTAAEMNMVCNVMGRDTGEIKAYYHLCCAFKSVDKVPDLVSLVQSELVENGKYKLLQKEKNKNRSIIDFLDSIENQYKGGMMKVGSSMAFEYRGRNIKAKVIGVGTSAVVFRFSNFDGNSPDKEIDTLNYYLQRFAFRRITFTNRVKAKVFWYHQLAQLCFLNENDIDTLPVRIWGKDKSRSVFIAQPYLEDSDRLEHYFKVMVEPGHNGVLSVHGETMTDSDFLKAVTEKIVHGINKLSKMNQSYTLMNSNKDTKNIMEGFVDAKYPNYAIGRHPETNGLHLSYFDLFPAHLRLFERHPMDSNGHTHFEVFDAYFQRDNSEDELIRNGMVGTYKKKYNSYRDPKKMLTKLGASAIDLIFDGIDFRVARDVLVNGASNQELKNRLDLVHKVVKCINNAAIKHLVRSQVDFKMLVEYWDRRVKTNMWLRLALHYLEISGAMAACESAQTSQLMSRSQDEDTLLDWVQTLYTDDQAFRQFITAGRARRVAPDTAIKVFRQLVELFSGVDGAPERAAVAKIYPLLSQNRPEQRPIGVTLSEWQGRPGEFTLAHQPSSISALSALTTDMPQNARKQRLPSDSELSESGCSPTIASTAGTGKIGVGQGAWGLPQLAITHAETKTFPMPLGVLASEIRRAMSVSNASDGCSANNGYGVLLTKGIRPVHTFTTNATLSASALRYGRQEKSRSAPNYSVNKSATALPEFAHANVAFRQDLLKALAPIMPDMIKKVFMAGIRLRVHPCTLSAQSSGSPLAAGQSTSVATAHIRGEGEEACIIDRFRAPMEAHDRFEGYLTRRHSLLESQRTGMITVELDEESEFLQLLTVDQDLKILIEDVDQIIGGPTNNKVDRVYLLQAYRLIPGVWAALYQLIDPLTVAGKIRLWTAQGRNWLRLTRYHKDTGSGNDKGKQVSWSLTGSSYLTSKPLPDDTPSPKSKTSCHTRPGASGRELHGHAFNRPDQAPLSSKKQSIGSGHGRTSK